MLRGPYKRNEYRKVILPLTVLRRFDLILAPTKQRVLDASERLYGKGENIVRARLEEVSGQKFYNLSKLDFEKLLDDPNQIAPNFVSYINAFSPNVRQIIERFKFEEQISRMSEKNVLYEVVQSFARADLSPERLDNMQMGYVFEELIRIGAEQSNEEAGEHFTPREVISLMVNLLLSDEPDLTKSHIVKTIYDPACGTGGMLSSAEQFILAHNSEARPHLFGQDWNDEAYAICKSDMLIKGEDADNVKLGDTFASDGFPDKTFDYMLANPPFGVSWKQQQRAIQREHDSLGYDGRFGAGLPSVDDGALLFLQHMISKMRSPQDGGSRVAVVFNGSPLFTGDAGSGPSEIRRWIMENDWLEAVVALPEQLFYNTGISTYIWIVTNRKSNVRKGRVQLLDARTFWLPMKKSLGKKRRLIGEKEIDLITSIYGNFHDEEEHDGRTVSKVFDNEDFGYRKITVERPLRLNFCASAERIVRIEAESTFINLAISKKKDEGLRLAEVSAGEERQQTLRDLLQTLRHETGEELFTSRSDFIAALKETAQASGVRLTAAEQKVVLAALAERDEGAEVCANGRGEPEADAEMRDTEIVPLKESVGEYFEREVEPHVPGAWVDHQKTKVGYEIPLTRHFYRYEPPRPLQEIEDDLASLERRIVGMLKDVVA